MDKKEFWIKKREMSRGAREVRIISKVIFKWSRLRIYTSVTKHSIGINPKKLVKYGLMRRVRLVV